MTIKELFKKLKEAILCPHLELDHWVAHARGTQQPQFFFLYKECKKCNKQKELLTICFNGKVFSSKKPSERITWGYRITSNDLEDIKAIIKNPNSSRENPLKKFMQNPKE